MSLVYRNARQEKYRVNDQTATGAMFVAGVAPESIEHAEPALCTWAVELVADLVTRESDVMVKPDSGLHLRASSKKSSKHMTTWEKIDGFSLRGLQSTAERNAPILWRILSSYTDPESIKQTRAVAIRKYRPKNIVCSSMVGALTFTRSSRASLYPLARGVWYFAVKAHQSVYRVESRLGQSVSYESVRKALRAMAEAKQDDLRNAMRPGSGRHFIVVGDNVQAYAKQRDHRIGQENKMIKGFAGTAIEMEDVDPAAFDMDDFVARQNRLERKQLSADMILQDINWEHQDHVGAFQFLHTLVTFVPSLSIYSEATDAWEKNVLGKNQIPPTRRSNTIPLATNSADEMTVQGMKQAVDEFLGAQMGINEETLNKRLLVVTGDGKTFDQLLKVKRYLATHEGDFESLRCVVPLLELWHTKWTDLSRIVRTHWGDGSLNDPSSLARMANEIEMPTPSDLRKLYCNFKWEFSPELK
ncbi:hypothetical protein JAAARDRAFT_164426, partial [Jaapia argillacea MUCL 33604]